MWLLGTKMETPKLLSTLKLTSVSIVETSDRYGYKCVCVQLNKDEVTIDNNADMYSVIIKESYTL